MIRLIAVIALSASACLAQGATFEQVVNSKAPVISSGPVSVDGTALLIISNNNGGTGCVDNTTVSNPGSACQMSATNGVNVPTSGDTLDVAMMLCMGPSCTTALGGAVVGATCGATTLTAISGASQTITSGSVRSQYRFYAPNMASGTCTLSITCTNVSSYLTYYAVATVTYLKGANTSTPLDTSVSNVATGSSTAPSVTSFGNVSQTGEVAVAVFSVDGTPTNSGGCSTTLGSNNSDTDMFVAKTGPTSGSGLTCAITSGSSGPWVASIASYHP